jgi:hypothetical protein
MSNADPFKSYEAARKLMYAAMEKEGSEPIEARNLFDTALDYFGTFLEQAAKSRGMYRELEKKAAKMRDTCENKLRALGKIPKRKVTPPRHTAPVVSTPVMVRQSSPEQLPKPSMHTNYNKRASSSREPSISPRISTSPRINAPAPKVMDSPTLTASVPPSRLSSNNNLKNTGSSTSNNTEETGDMLQMFASRLLRSGSRSRRRFMPDSDSDTDDSVDARKTARTRATPTVKQSPATHQSKLLPPTPQADYTPKPRSRSSLGMATTSTTTTSVTVSTSTAAGRAKTPMRIDSDSDDDEFVRWPRNRCAYCVLCCV